MKIHIGCVGVHVIADYTMIVFHAKVLNFVAGFLQIFAKHKDIGFRTSVGVQEFVHHQDFQSVSPLCSHRWKCTYLINSTISKRDLQHFRMMQLLKRDMVLTSDVESD